MKCFLPQDTLKTVRLLHSHFSRTVNFYTNALCSLFCCLLVAQHACVFAPLVSLHICYIEHAAVGLGEGLPTEEPLHGWLWESIGLAGETQRVSWYVKWLNWMGLQRGLVWSIWDRQLCKHGWTSLNQSCSSLQRTVTLLFTVTLLKGFVSNNVYIPVSFRLGPKITRLLCSTE